MRTDEGTTYYLPGLYNIEDDNPDQAKYWKKGITFNLQGLPMIHEDGVQTGVGARGWYNSAVLSALMLLSWSSWSSSSDDTSTDDIHVDSVSHDVLRQDMMHLMKQQERPDTKNPTVLEIGAGALGLVGMTMAWILSHKQIVAANSGTTKNDDWGMQDEEEKREMMDESKIILTDNDLECLGQLQCNANSVLESLLDFNSVMKTSNKIIDEKEDWKEQDERSDHHPIPFLSLPSIQTKILDWDDHAISQEVLDNNKIDFVVGSELAYCTNNCCALQVAKILELNPAAVIWIVQFPRNGWFKVFQMELEQRVSNVRIQKMDPTTIHKNVHELAQSIMPMPSGVGTNLGNDDVATHENFQWQLEDIKALRITLNQAVDDDDEEEEVSKNVAPTKTFFDLSAQIERTRRLSQQLNTAQEFSLDSHWEIG